MGVLYNPPFTVEDAVARAHDVFEVVFTDWGITGANPPVDFTNLQFPQPGQPGLPITLAGIAIGPKSTVDRAWVTYNLGKRANVTDPVTAYNLIRMVSVESPLVFTQASNPGQRNNPTNFDDPVKTLTEKGALYVYPFVDRPNSGAYAGSAVQVIQPGQPNALLSSRNDSTVLPLEYRDANGVTRKLRNEIVPTDTRTAFVSPTLHLYCYLKSPYHYPPTRRAPLQYRGVSNVPLNDGLPADERCIVQVPTFGRRRIVVEAHMNPDLTGGVGNATFRLGGIPSIGQLEDVQEVTLTTSAAVAAGVPVLLEFNTPGMDYVNLYVTCPVLLPLATAPMAYAVTAYD